MGMLKRDVNKMKRLAGLLNENEEVSPNLSLTKSEAVGVASDWHGGQNSILYSLASTKEFFPEHYDAYVRDIQFLINREETSGDPSNVTELKQLLSWVERQKEGSDALESVKASMNDFQKRALNGYLDGIRWASSDEDMFKEYTNYDFSKEAIEGAAEDIKRFIELADGFLEGLDPEQVGTDLWFTRNGHGAGFWDRKYLEKEQQEKLTQISKSMKEAWDYVGDDGKIHIQ